MIDKWQFDSLKVMLAFETYLGITPHEWTQADAALDQIPQGVVDERRAGVLDCLSELEREITRGVLR